MSAGARRGGLEPGLSSLRVTGVTTPSWVTTHVLA